MLDCTTEQMERAKTIFIALNGLSFDDADFVLGSCQSTLKDIARNLKFNFDLSDEKAMM